MKQSASDQIIKAVDQRLPFDYNLLFEAVVESNPGTHPSVILTSFNQTVKRMLADGCLRPLYGWTGILEQPRRERVLLGFIATP